MESIAVPSRRRSSPGRTDMHPASPSLVRRARLRALVFAVALVTAACGGGSNAGPTTPTPTPALTSIALSISASSLTVGSTAQLTATPKDQSGGTMTATVSYASSAPSVASVNASGLVTAVAAGQTVLTASSGSVSNTVTLTVTAGAFPSAATVTTPGNAFAPFQVDIAVNGTVQWQFGSVAHNVLFDATAGAPAAIPISSSANVSRTFATKGTFNYQCSVHTGMIGTVVVH